MKNLKILLLLVLCNLFWAGNYVFGKYVTAEISPIGLTFVRWSIAACFLFPLANYLEKPDWRKIKSEWLILLLMGMTGLVTYNYITYTALQYTSSTNAALVSALNPSLLVIFSAYLLKERVAFRQGMGLMISLLGVLIILTQGKLWNLLRMEYNRGDLLMLIAIVAWSIYSVLGKRLKRVPPITATAVSSLVAIAFTAPFAAMEGLSLQQMSGAGVAGIIYIALFPSVASFAIWNLGVQKIGASRAGIFLNLIPVFTAMISWMLGSSVTLFQVIGGLVTFCGVSITTGIFEKRKALESV